MSWALRPHTEFAAVSDEWQRLCRERYAGHPFLDTRFVESALTAFANDGVSLAIADGAPGGMALVHRRSRWVVESFCPSQLPMALLRWDDDRVDAAALRGLLAAAGGRLFGLLHYDELFHQPIDGDAGLMNSVDYAPTMNVALDGSFEDYWRGRSKNLRRNISRYQNRAERDDFEISLEEVTGEGDMSAAVSAYSRIESAGWKGQVGSAILDDNEQGRFYRELLQRFAGTGDARVFHLRMNEKIVASRLMVQAGGTALILKTTYDEDFSRYAPGRVLLYLVLQRLFEDERIDQVEFYTKANADQLQWATGTRMIRHYNLYSGRAVALLSSLARTLQGSRGKKT